MTTPMKNLEKLGLSLPKSPEPVGSYLPAVRTGNLIYTSGQLPFSGGELVTHGKVPKEVCIEEAQAAARICVLNALAAAVDLAGSLDKIKRIVRMNCFVASSAGFTSHAMVANGASDLLGKIFGEHGKHTRCAIGASELPLNSPVEIDIIVEV